MQYHVVHKDFGHPPQFLEISRKFLRNFHTPPGHPFPYPHPTHYPLPPTHTSTHPHPIPQLQPPFSPKCKKTWITDLFPTGFIYRNMYIQGPNFLNFRWSPSTWTVTSRKFTGIQLDLNATQSSQTVYEQQFHTIPTHLDLLVLHYLH